MFNLHTKFISTQANYLLHRKKNIIMRMLHSKVHHGHCKIIIDPFSNYTGDSQNFDLVFRINNQKIPLPIDILEITSDINIHMDTESQMNPDQLFDYQINEQENKFYIDSKPKEKLSENLKDLIFMEKRFHFILRVKNSKHVHVELSNCDLTLHNSTHFKYELEEKKSLEKSNDVLINKNLTPIEINPNFEKFSCFFDNSTINFEKFDHKFLNGYYAYDFRIENNSDVKLKRLFLHKMEMSLDSSKIFIEKISGYKISKADENNTKNLVSIKANKSELKIFNFVNCGNFLFNSSNSNSENLPVSQSNILSIDNFSSNSLDIQLSEKDKIDLNLNEILDNSHIKFNASNELKVRIHPALLCGINIFQEFNKKFMKILFFEDEGFVKSPTLVLNGDKEWKKKDITGWELVKLRSNKYFKRIILISLFVFIANMFVSDKSNLNATYSEFKLYQLFLKKTFEDYLEKISK